MERSVRHRPLRVAVLWTKLSGFVHAELTALRDQGVEVLVFHQKAGSDAPFGAAVTAGLTAECWEGEPDEAALKKGLDEFNPDAMIVVSWNVGAYRRVAGQWRGRTLRILVTSNQWKGTAKQWGGIALSRFIIRPNYDAALLPDERAAIFTRKLGLTDERFIWGLNTCDYPKFAAVADRRGDALPDKVFVFVGRLVAEKDLGVLAAAYEQYRAAVEDPWPLHIVGTGPDDHLLRGRDGVEMVGFVQPGDLPDVFEKTGCLLLPSKSETWGVVIQEAAAAGLPVICSTACGASTRLVLDGYNGAVVTPGNVNALARALRRLHVATDEERQALGEGSRQLARQYTPERWARNLMSRVPELRELVGLSPSPWLEPASTDPQPEVAVGV